MKAEKVPIVRKAKRYKRVSLMKLATTLLLAAVATLTFAQSSEAKPADESKVKTEKFALAVPKLELKKYQVITGSRQALNHSNTIWGATGLIFIPTAYTSENRTANWSAVFTDDTSGAAVNYGIIRDVEIGAAFLDFDGSKDKAIANGKVRIVPSNFDQFEIGIGVMDIADAVDQTIYVVGSVDLVVPEQAAERGGFALRAHAGVGTGYFSEKLFGGAELLFERGFSLIGEYDSKTLNAALRYRHNDEFYITGGIYSNSLMFGMTYNMRF